MVFNIEFKCNLKPFVCFARLPFTVWQGISLELTLLCNVLAQYWNTSNERYGWGWHVCMHMLTHSHTMTPFDAPGKQTF